MASECFLNTYGELEQFLIEDVEKDFEMPPTAVNWIKELIAHNVQGGKMNRGISVITSLLCIKPSASEEEKKRAIVAGWCVEWLQAFFLVADDIMDRSEKRRGKPCWYLCPKPLPASNGEQIQIIACNDSFILESMIYRLLKKYVRSCPNYLEILELFHEVTYQTELGQLLDLTAQPSSAKNDINLFTIETYNRIAKYKTAFYSFYLPVTLAMHIAGGFVEAQFIAVREILLSMGIYFQVQDDFLDCYGTFEQIGKVGRDIEENKCGWLIVKALELVNNEQRQVIEANYGKDDPACVASIKQIFNDIDIPSVFKAYEEESYSLICSQINNLSEEPLKLCLNEFLKKIYKRNK